MAMIDRIDGLALELQAASVRIPLMPIFDARKAARDAAQDYPRENDGQNMGRMPGEYGDNPHITRDADQAAAVTAGTTGDCANSPTGC